jgi:hypothetical protein
MMIKIYLCLSKKNKRAHPGTFSKAPFENIYMLFAIAIFSFIEIRSGKTHKNI